MAFIIHENRITKDTIDAVHHNPIDGGAAIIDLSDTDRKNLGDRSPMKSYDYRAGTSGKTYRLTIELNGFWSTGGWAILGCSRGFELVSIKAKQYSSYTDEADEIVKYTRYINGFEIVSYAGTFLHKNRVYNAIEIEYIKSGEPNYIGTVVAGDVVEFNFKDKLDVSYKSVGTKTRTHGGQIKGQLTSVYRIAKFKTTNITQEKLESEFAPLNYNSGDVKPVVFIPTVNEDWFVYGPQLKPFSQQNMDKKASNNKWFYQLSFELEEEF